MKSLITSFVGYACLFGCASQKPAENPANHPEDEQAPMADSASSSETSSEQSEEGAAPTDSKQLAQADIMAVAVEERANVKTKCWDPIRKEAVHLPSEPVRSMFSFTIRAQGDVRQIQRPADPPDFPGLSECVANEIATWKFPATQRDTTVNIPLVFEMPSTQDAK